MKTCANCLLPASVPGSDLADHALCKFCRDYDASVQSKDKAKQENYRRDLEKTLQKTRGKGHYDCLVALSGGKDSVYLLYKMVKEYKLRTLAFVTDMNVPEVAWDNINRAVKALDVDLEIYRPSQDFYRRFYTYLLQNQNEGGAVKTVCYVCAPLFEGYALKLAVDKEIPLVVAGYSPGQPDPERMEYEFSRKLIEKTDWTPDILKKSGLFSKDELALFWNPNVYPKTTPLPRYLAPFHAWDYNQETVINTVVELGLIKNSSSANPIHSNCPLNWLLMYSDIKNLGYNPYNPEFSKLIREGKANKWYWKIMLPIVNFMIKHKIFLGKNVRTSFKELGLKPDQLIINRKS